MDEKKHAAILGPVDTAFFYVDSRETPMNIGAVTIFEGKIDFESFVKLVDSRIHQIPLYQQKIVQAPLSLGQPTWMFDPDFYIENHVFKLTLDPPGTDEELREMAGALISSMLDRSKPLWEIYLLEGLSGDRTAIFFKTHHCMVDGLSAVEIFSILLDIVPETKPIPEKPLYDPPKLPTTPQLVIDAFRRDIPNKLNLLGKLTQEVSYFSSVLTDKEKRRSTLVGIANLINDNLSPIKKLAINGTNSGIQAIAWSEFPLDEVKAIRATVKGASVNDVMLSVLGNAVGMYLRQHGTTKGQDVFRVIVPVNMREEQEKGKYGNRISVLPIELPMYESDPIARLQKVMEYTRVMKQSSLSHGLDMILTLPSLAPSPTQPLIWHVAPSAFAFIAHSWCTNVAGPPLPVYLLGHKMLHTCGYFPLNPGNGLATVILSYNGAITMNLITDTAIVTDVKELRRYVEETYVKLRQAANVPPTSPPAPPAVKVDKPIESVQVEPTAPAAAELRPAETVTEAAAPAEAIIPEPAPANPVGVEAAVEVPPAPTTAAPTSVEVAEAAVSAEPVVVEVAAVEAAPEPVAVATAVVEEASSVARNGNAPVNLNPVASASAQPIGAEMTLVVDGASTPAKTADVEQPVPATVPEPAAPSAKPAINGHAAPLIPPSYEAQEGVEASPPPAIDVQPTEAAKQAPEGKPKLFSEAWAQAFRQAINNNPAYYKASQRWEAGALAFVIEANPRFGFPKATAVLMDLHRGICRDAHNVPVEEAMAKAAFVIQADYDNWMKVLSGKAQPLVMLMRGGLRLKKGSMTRLMPFTQSAQELVHSAQSVT